MRKRSGSPCRGESAPYLLLSRDRAEKMCQKKLIQVKKEKSKLCQTVLVRNTLKYVQSSNKSTFAFVNTFQPEHFVPFSKKSCSDITSEDIEELLRNRSNCTITKFTMERRNMNCHTILHS